MPRPLTLEDIFAIERVIDAQISPDGTRIAFAVMREYAEGEHDLPASAVWIVPFDGSAPPRQFTASPHADSYPRWSPDGRSLAFLSDRGKADVQQLYVMPADGGEARKLTDNNAGIAGFKWSPEGRRLAYLAPDAKSEEEEKREKERDDTVHVDHDYKFTRLWVVDVEGSTAKAVTPPAYQVRDFAWHREGWAIVTSPTPKEDDAMLPWPVRYVAEESEATTLWEGKYAVLPLNGSPDGQGLAWIHGGAAGEESADELWVLRAGEQPRMVAADYQGGLAWAGGLPDSRSLLVAALDGTRTVLATLDPESGEFATLLAGRTLAEGFTSSLQASVSADGARFACVLEEVDAPGQIFAFERGAEPRRLTSFNDFLGDVALGKAETVRWSASDGQEIEGILILPAGYEAGKRYPLVVQVHGGPTWQWLNRFLLGWHDWGEWLAAQGYAVLLPNPRGSGGRGREFAWCNRRNWGTGDLGDVLSGVDYAIARGVADPERLGIGGWSYGGYLTSWAIGHTDRFKAAVVGAGVTDLLSFQAADIPTWLPREMMLAPSYREPEVYLRCSPITYVANATTPTLVLHGAADERVRLGQGKELYHALRALGVSTEMAIYPREPHIFKERHHQRDLLTRVRDWFDRWVKGAAADDTTG